MKSVETECAGTKDNHLVKKIKTSLDKDGYGRSLKSVKIAEQKGHIVLSGKVKSYFLKQTAQVIALRSLDSVNLLQNKILVDYDLQS